MPENFGSIATLSESARNDNVAVGTSSVLIAEVRNLLNPRRDILVRNISPTSSEVISVTIGTQLAVANTGIVLKQNESFVFSTSEGNLCPQAQFSAICSTANGIVSIFER